MKTTWSMRLQKIKKSYEGKKKKAYALQLDPEKTSGWDGRFMGKNRKKFKKKIS